MQLFFNRPSTASDSCNVALHGEALCLVAIGGVTPIGDIPHAGFPPLAYKRALVQLVVPVLAPLVRLIVSTQPEGCAMLFGCAVVLECTPLLCCLNASEGVPDLPAPILDSLFRVVFCCGCRRGPNHVCFIWLGPEQLYEAMQVHLPYPKHARTSFGVHAGLAPLRARIHFKGNSTWLVQDCSGSSGTWVRHFLWLPATMQCC